MKDMEQTYRKKLVAICGKSGAGKDTVAKRLCQKLPDGHFVTSCTTRPKRDYEVDGKDYHFMTEEEFNQTDLLESTEFNDWHYGTPKFALKDKKINIGVFNPAGIVNMLMNEKNDDLDIFCFLVKANDKIRLIRCLNREDNPNCHEICRRFFTDEKDFETLNFGYEIIKNNSFEELEEELHNCRAFHDFINSY